MAKNAAKENQRADRSADKPKRGFTRPIVMEVESSCAPFFIFTGAGKDQVRHGGDQDDGGAGAADRIGQGDGGFKRLRFAA